jgi:hypothetical protein
MPVLRKVRGAAVAATSIATLACMVACNGGNTPAAPIVTSVGKSVVTLHKASPLSGCTANQMPPPPMPATNAPEDQFDPQPWWDGLPPQNKLYPFAGWTAFQPGPGGCAGVRTDSYRAVAVFNMAGVSQLKGLVKTAELVVSVRALPPAQGPGAVITAGPLGQVGSINLFCPQSLGGAGSLVRFGPNAPVPTANPTGSFELLGANTFPSGTNTVYTLPTFLVPGQSVAGPIANATDPSTIGYSGNGGATIVTDVTGQVTAALNGNFATMAWMLTSNFEGSLPKAFNVPATLNCRTSYDFDLRITHY